MLQTIREYAHERLDADPELAASIRQAHAVHYTERALAPPIATSPTPTEPASSRPCPDLVNLTAWDHWVDDVDHRGSVSCSSRSGATRRPR